MASPDYRSKREDSRGRGGGSGDYNQGSKQMRTSSPTRGVDRDRETHWDGPSSRRRPLSPPPTLAWDREDRPRARKLLPPPSRIQENPVKFKFLPGLRFNSSAIKSYLSKNWGLGTCELGFYHSVLAC
jgi:hypothetical protein